MKKKRMALGDYGLVIAGVALLGFIIWVTSVVVQVQRQRQALEARIGWIFIIQELQESPKPETIQALHQQLRTSPDVTAKAVMDKLEPLWLEPEREIDASRLQASLGVIRGANAQASAKLGRSWDVLYALALISCLLGIGVVVLVWRARRQREALEQAQRALAQSVASQRFLSLMSHELRTPLNAIIGYAQLLSDELEELADVEGLAHLDQDVSKIEGAAQRLLVLIDDVLSLSEDAQALPAEPVALDELVARLRQRWPEVTFEQVEGGEALGSMEHLVRIMNHLIQNAQVFGRSPQGISVFVRADEVNRACVGVRDHGPGLKPEAIKALLEPFAQGDASSTRRRDGAGLGLAVCSSFARRMGGQLHVQSEPGQGLEAWVSLPKVR